MSFFSQYKPYYKQTLKLAVPVVISQLGQHSVQLVDTAMVGNLGTPEESAIGLAGVSFANLLAWPVLVLGMGLAMGLTPLVIRAVNRSDSERVSSLLKNSFVVNALFGVLISMLLMGVSFFMGHMGQDPEILPIARQYFYYMVASAIPIMLYSTCRQFLEGFGNTTYSMVIVITTNIINVVLNFGLIYGLWGLPEMGAVGAGASTFIARSMQILLFAALFYYKSEYRKYFRGFGRIKLCRFRIRRLLNVGLPIGMQSFIEVTALSLMGIAVGFFGADALSAHQIAFQIPSTSFMVIMGLQAATTIRVGQEAGLRLYDNANKTFHASLHIITAFMLAAALIIMVFARPIAAAFTNNETVIAMAVNFLYLSVIFQIPDGIQGVGLGGLRGLMLVNKPMYYEIIIYAMVALPVGYVCSFQLGMGAYGTWIGFITALALFSVLFYRLFRKTINERKLYQQTSLR